MSACPPWSPVAQGALVAELGVVADLFAFCERTGVLVDSPDAAGIWAASSDVSARLRMPDAPALPVVVPAGVTFPDALVDAGGRSTQMILVGRMGDAGQGCGGQASCRRALLVDRVAWAAGTDQDQATSVLPSLLVAGPRLDWRPRNTRSGTALGSAGPLLMETMVDLPTLARVDPAAATMVTASAPTANRIWYRRALGTDPGWTEVIWVAIDDATGEVLADGSSTTTSG
jgi:hypothetical protein